MNKIIDSKKNILKICAGNDFSIVVQITEYDTETGAWVNYDLSAVNDVHMTLVAENGKHIKLPVVVNEDGTVSAPVQAAYLQKSTYGIELTWVTNDLNRRTYSPCLMQIVTTTAESSSNIAEYETNDAYHFNIKMQADVAILSIGKISDEYITEDEVDNKLENYVTNSALSTTLDSYATVSSLNDYATKQYVDDEIANIDLTDYYTKSEINTTLESYVTDSELNTAISPFITNLDLSNVLENYVSNVALEQDLEDYAKFEDLTSYAKFEDLTSYATTQYVDNEIATSLGNYVESSHLYDNIYTKSQVDTKDANERNYVNSNFYNTTQVDRMLTNYVNDAEYDSTNHNILFKHDSSVIATIDASPFIVDGMVDNVEISNGNLVISFNTDAGKQDISIPISQIFDASNYYTKSEVDAALANIDLSNYVTTSDLTTRLADYALDSDMTAAESDITSLDSRVTTLEQNPSVPSNVVTSDDGNEIVCLTQSEYDTLEQNQQLDPDVFYYITDSTSNYVTNSSLSTTLSNYATQNYVDTAVAGVTIDETNLVHKNNSETITGAKTFNAENTFNYGSTLQYQDNLTGFYKSSLFSRGSFNQACIGEILLPNQSVSNSSWSLNNVANEVGFYTVTGGPSTMTKTQVAKIDSTGIYEGTTLLSDKYALKSEIPTSSGVSEEDWDNANEAIAQELLDNRLEHQTINSNFSNYYTKTEADSRYATAGWANNKFVTKTDNENQNQAIAAAFASSVQSTSVHNIWTGSQNDYDAITTKDTNTLYVIL